MAPIVSSSGVSPWNTVTLRLLSSTLIQFGTVRRVTSLRRMKARIPLGRDDTCTSSHGPWSAITRKTSGSPYLVGLGRARPAGTPPAPNSSTDGTAASATTNDVGLGGGAGWVVTGALTDSARTSVPVSSALGGRRGARRGSTGAVVVAAGAATAAGGRAAGGSGATATAVMAPAAAPAKAMADPSAAHPRIHGAYPW